MLAVSAVAARPSANAAGSPGLALGKPYLDPTFGFALRPPVDAVATPVRGPVRDSRVECVRFTVEPKRWALTVGVQAAPGSTKPAAVLDALQKERRARVGDVRVEARSDEPMAARAAAAGSFRLHIDGIDWTEHVAVIAMPPNRFLVLRFESPATTDAAARQALAATLGTLRFPDSALTTNILNRALRQGAALLERIKQRLPTLELVPETYLRVTRSGRGVGVIRQTEQRTSDGTTNEIAIDVHAFSFIEGEPPRERRESMHTSDSLSGERWQYQAWTARRASEGGLARQLVEVERGLRERNMLVLSFTDTAGQMLRTNQTREVPPGYFPRALIPLLPRIVDLETPTIYAFPCYSRALRGIVTRIIRVAGAEQTEVNGRSVRAYRISDRETVLGPDTHCFVDAGGHLLKVVRDQDTFVPMPRAVAERMLHDGLSAYRKRAVRPTGTASAPASAHR